MVNIKKLLVLGSINMDVILKIKAVPKAGESVLTDDVRTAPGGKGANQAVAAARLGCPTTFICMLGDDAYGIELFKNLRNNNVDASHVKLCGEPTGTAYIILEPNGQNRIIVSAGANMAFDRRDLTIIENIIDDYDMVLLQLEIPHDFVKGVISIAKSKNKKVIVDAGPARGCDPRMFKGVYILSPNESEAEHLTGIEINNLEDAMRASDILLQYDISMVVLKMGDKGALYADGKTHRLVPAYKTQVVDTTAAGDSFTAAMASRLLEGQDIIEAIEYGNKAGSLTVRRMGAQPSLPYKEEIEKFRFELP